MNRREFLKGLFGATAAALVGCKKEEDVNPTESRLVGVDRASEGGGYQAGIDSSSWVSWNHYFNWGWNSSPPVSVDTHEMWQVSNDMWFSASHEGDYSWWVWNENEWQEFEAFQSFWTEDNHVMCIPEGVSISGSGGELEDVSGFVTKVVTNEDGRHDTVWEA